MSWRDRNRNLGPIDAPAVSSIQLAEYVRGMDFRELESFVAVAEELHFHRAATRVHLSQPALTRHIRRLEDELGVELLRRTSRHVEVTEAGLAFLDEVRVVLGRADRARRLARQVGRRPLVQLAIGHVDGACYVVLPSAVRSLRSEFGEASILLSELGSSDLLSLLQTGEFDIVFTRTPGVEETESRKVMDERVLVALPSGHRLTKRTTVPLAALAEEDFVMFGRHHSPVAFGLIDEACRGAGFSPRIREEVEPTLSRLVLAASGVGVTLATEALPQCLRIPDLEWRPLAGYPISLPLYAQWRADDPRSTTTRLVELFVAEAQSRFSARRRAGSRDWSRRRAASSRCS